MRTKGIERVREAGVVSGLKRAGIAVFASAALAVGFAATPARAQVPYQCPYGYDYSAADCWPYGWYAPFDDEALGFGGSGYGRHGGWAHRGFHGGGFSGGSMPHGGLRPGFIGGDHLGGGHFGGGRR